MWIPILPYEVHWEKMTEWSRLCLGSGLSSVERPKTSHRRLYFGTSAEARRGNKLKARHEGFVKEQPELFGQLVKNLSSTHFEKAPDFFSTGFKFRLGAR